MRLTLDQHFHTLRSALGDRYELDSLLGRGGMGVVYRAREVSLDRPVAIKVLLPERAQNAEARARFVREARIAARLSHPHVIPIFAVQESDSVVFYTMAYVEGSTLEERIRTEGRLSPEEAARVMRETARALAHAHARGVIHRDIKPDNILIERETNRVFVSDFGIARDGSNGTTDPHLVLGSAEFISPEQTTGMAADPRSDIYALGVLGFYALTGWLPFAGASDRATLVQHVSAPVPSLTEVQPGVPRRLARIIERCLQKRPEARFQSAEALAEALAELRFWSEGGLLRRFLIRLAGESGRPG